MKKNFKMSKAEIIVSATAPCCLCLFLLVLKVVAVLSKGSICISIESDAGSGSEKPVQLPDALRVPEMREQLDALVDAGVLASGYQLKDQSWTERAVIVAYLSGKLGNKCMWSAFAQLWHCDMKVLKSAYAKHVDSLAGREYFRKLEKILN